MLEVTICIANYYGHEALELTIESILKRTAYNMYKITVLDSGADYRDLRYLKQQKAAGNLHLIEYPKQIKHGEAIFELLRRCRTPLACIVDSDIEVLTSTWLSVLAQPVNENQSIIGTGVYQPENAVPTRFWRMPRFLPMCLLVNLRAYEKTGDRDTWRDDWVEAYIDWQDCRQKTLFSKFGAHPYIANGIREKANNQVFGDTGWRFCEKVSFDYRLPFHRMPYTFYQDHIQHWGAISIWNADENIPDIQSKIDAIRKRLAQLRQ